MNKSVEMAVELFQGMQSSLFSLVQVFLVVLFTFITFDLLLLQHLQLAFTATGLVTCVIVRILMLMIS